MIDDIEFLDDATRPVAPKLTGLTPDQREPGLHLKDVHNHLRGNMKMLRTLIDRASQGEVSQDQWRRRPAAWRWSPTSAASATSAASTARS